MELGHFKQAVAASGEVVFMTDLDGLFTFVNPSFEQLYGYTSDELVGRCTPRVLKSGLTPAEFYVTLWTQLLRGQIVRDELINRTKTGQMVVVDSSANPICDETGSVVGFLAVQRDITDRKRHEIALRDSEARYRTLAENSPDEILIVGRSMLVEYVNAAALARLGVAADLVLGKPLDDNAASGRIVVGRRDVEQAIDSHASAHEEYKVMAGTGTLWMSTWLVPIAGDHGDVRGVLIVSRDVTAMKGLEAQLYQSLKMEAIGRLAGGIAHDFNNLLTSIVGYSELVLDDDCLPTRARADIEQILKAGQSATTLTRQLLTMSRERTVEPAWIDVNVVLRGFQKVLQRTIGEDTAIELALTAEPAWIFADTGQLEQVLMNLAINARDAMPSGGVVRLCTAHVERAEKPSLRQPRQLFGRCVRLTVSDTGTGMTPEVQTRVFEPFFTTKAPDHGTGLGLSMVYGIVTQHGGSIDVTSQLGLGTTFTIDFPGGDGHNVVDAISPEASPRPSRAHGETVLLVEDDASLRSLLLSTLSRLGYSTLTASDGLEALEVAAAYQGPIALLLTDVVMPSLGGGPLARQLTELRPDLRVIFMSGYSKPRVAAEGVLGEGHFFLQKPFEPLALQQAVRNALSRPVSVAATAVADGDQSLPVGGL